MQSNIKNFINMASKRMQLLRPSEERPLKKDLTDENQAGASHKNPGAQTQPILGNKKRIETVHVRNFDPE